MMRPQAPQQGGGLRVLPVPIGAAIATTGATSGAGVGAACSSSCSAGAITSGRRMRGNPGSEVTRQGEQGKETEACSSCRHQLPRFSVVDAGVVCPIS